MGACAGCVGPNRRAENYQVNRLTENSPIKNRVSVSELPPSRNKDRIMEELNQSKRKYEQTNLINTLINGSPQMDKSLPSRLSRGNESPDYRDSIPPRDPLYTKEEYARSSGLIQLKRTDSGSILDRKPESLNLYDENQQRIASERPVFISEFRGEPQRLNSKVLAEIRMNKNGESGFGLKKKGLSNIPQLADEDAKTPTYVKQIRKQNGEDVHPTALDFLPKQLPPAPRLSLQTYLRELS